MGFELASGPRVPAVAGMFYPSNPDQLRTMVRGFLSQATVRPGSAPKALIAPHAGYIYSGPIAAQAFAQWEPDKDHIRRVLLLGPSHRVPIEGIALSSAPAWQTPLGLVEQDVQAIEQLIPLPFVEVSETSHADEHSLEVELPFLQVVLPHFKLVSIMVGYATPKQVAQCLDLLWGGPETRIVISSDLSHYLDYSSAREQDQTTAAKIERLTGDELEPEEACGCRPVAGFLHTALDRHMRCQLLDLRNSGDTAGTRGRVVGYGAFAFYESASPA